MWWSIAKYSYVEHIKLSYAITMALMDKFTCVHMNWQKLQLMFQQC